MKSFKFFRSFSRTKEQIDPRINAQRGTFSNRSPKDLETVFGINFYLLNTTKDLDLGESSLDRLPIPTQEYLLNSIYRYNSTFPENQRLKRDFDNYTGNELHMSSIIEFFIRSLILSTYEEGIMITSQDPIILDNGTRKGNHDLVIYRGGYPILIIRYAKPNENIRGYPMEQAFCNNIFEVYASYWKNKV